MQSYTTRKRDYDAQNQSGLFQKEKSLLKEIGLILKEAREKRNFNLTRIREMTCIPTHHIVSIEAGIREKLPEDLFLVGFLRRYAKAVGLDEYLICEMYLRNKKYKDPNKDTDAFDMLFNEEDKEERKKESNYQAEGNFLRVYHFYFFMAGVLLCIVSFLLIQFYFNMSQSQINTASEMKVSEIVLEEDTKIQEKQKTPVVKREINKSVVSKKQSVINKKLQIINKKPLVNDKTTKEAKIKETKNQMKVVEKNIEELSVMKAYKVEELKKIPDIKNSPIVRESDVMLRPMKSEIVKPN